MLSAKAICEEIFDNDEAFQFCAGPSRSQPHWQRASRPFISTKGSGAGGGWYP